MSDIQPFGSAIPVSRGPLDARLEFMRKTYLHLAGAVGLFIAIAWFVVTSGLAQHVAAFFWGGGMGYVMFLGAFMVGGWFASRLAHSASPAAQYFGLIFYAALYAVLFSPLMWVAANEAAFAGTLPQAAALTAVTFAGLTTFVLTTKKDMSFLRPFLLVGMLVAFGCIIASMIFGLNLGIWFSGAMILLSVGAILYDTSKIVHQYGPGQHVGAAVQLFASVMMLFYYVLMLLMQSRR